MIRSPLRCSSSVLPIAVLVTSALAQTETHPPRVLVDADGRPQITAENACGFRPASYWIQSYRAAIARGEVSDPSLRPPVTPPLRLELGPVDPNPCLTREHLFAFEDTAGVLQTNFSNDQMFDLMGQAYNAMIATHGDLYDFAGFFINYVPDHQIGAAFYAGLYNDVAGIGSNIFDGRTDAGVGVSNRIQGYVMMWQVFSWTGGAGPGTDFTRLALAQEFEHRFAMFLPDLLDGRRLQGEPGCGRGAHWNWKIDGQGSGMELSEWVGSSPANLAGSFVTFNTDIVGGVFGYSDLYLMGYVSPAEMDAGNSELRYMETSNCSSDYNGTISAFDSSDIVASAGARVPDSVAAQKDFRTGWIILHLPGSPPTNAERDHVVSILEQHQTDWNFSTLGRGTMNDTLFEDLNCDGFPDNGTSFCDNSDGSLGSCPCVNPGNPDTGCDIQQGTGGVRLDLVSQFVGLQNRATLSGTGFPGGTTPTALVIRGASLDPAAPVVFGDGLRCVSVPVVRLAATFASGGSSTHSFGHSGAVGSGTFMYQVWFRNTPAGFCTPDAFNLSSGRSIDW